MSSICHTGSTSSIAPRLKLLKPHTKSQKFIVEFSDNGDLVAIYPVAITDLERAKMRPLEDLVIAKLSQG